MTVSMRAHPNHHSDDRMYETGAHWIIHRWAILLFLIGVTTLVLTAWRGMSGDGASEDQFWSSVGLAFSFVSFIVAAIAWLSSSIGNNNLKIIVTTSRVIHQEGFFSVKEESFYLNGIHAVEIRQSWLGRLLGFGSVVIEAGEGRGREWRNIAAPRRIEREIGGHREHEHG